MNAAQAMTASNKGAIPERASKWLCAHSKQTWGRADRDLMPPRLPIPTRGDQHGARMRRHVQPVGHQRERSKNHAARDLDQHHHAAQCDDRPGLALVPFVAGAEEHVAVAVVCGAEVVGHVRIST